MKNINSPFHPIIYVRGYAMTKNEIDDASADPFYGFNLGSTIYRAVTDRSKPPSKFIFQSPLIRLITEHHYENVYRDGCDILDKGWEYDATGKPTGNELASRSLIIFRYYDIASSLLGNGKTPSIPELAKTLGDLILRTRELICKNAANQANEEDFRCHLVAQTTHSHDRLHGIAVFAPTFDATDKAIESPVPPAWHKPLPKYPRHQWPSNDWPKIQISRSSQSPQFTETTVCEIQAANVRTDFMGRLPCNGVHYRVKNEKPVPSTGGF